MQTAMIIQTLIDWIVGIGSSVNELPGTVAFGLGLFTWFAVEQVLRRIMSGMRLVIIVGAVVALGLSVPYLISLMMQNGGPTP